MLNKQYELSCAHYFIVHSYQCEKNTNKVWVIDGTTIVALYLTSRFSTRDWWPVFGTRLDKLRPRLRVASEGFEGGTNERRIDGNNPSFLTCSSIALVRL